MHRGEVTVILAILAILAILGTAPAACGERVVDAAAPSLEEIAAAWSGGRSDPTCRATGPGGKQMGPVRGAEHCEWPTVSRGGHSGAVTGTRDSLGVLTSLTWQRSVPDSAAAAQLVDSLARALAAAGLTSYSCRGGGRRWQRIGLGVQFMPVATEANGRRRVMVFATPVPEALPALLCPGAPASPPAPAVNGNPVVDSALPRHHMSRDRAAARRNPHHKRET